MAGFMHNKPEPKHAEGKTLEFDLVSLLPDGEYSIKYHYDGIVYVLTEEGKSLTPVTLPKDHGMRISSLKVLKLKQCIAYIDGFNLIRPAKK